MMIASSERRRRCGWMQSERERESHYERVKTIGQLTLRLWISDESILKSVCSMLLLACVPKGSLYWIINRQLIKHLSLSRKLIQRKTGKNNIALDWEGLTLERGGENFSKSLLTRPYTLLLLWNIQTLICYKSLMMMIHMLCKHTKL